MHITAQHLVKLSCNVPTSALGRKAIHTSDFLQLVSDRWISDEHINLMVAHIEKRLQASPPVIQTEVRDTTMSLMLRKAQTEAHYDAPSPRYLQLLESKLGARPRCILYFPVYLPEHHHWITIRVNFFRNEIAYGKQ